MKLKQEILRNVLKLEELKKERLVDKNVFRASEAGDCRKQIYLRRIHGRGVIQAKDELDRARILMLFSDGHMHQKELTRYIYQVPGISVTNIEDDRSIFVATGKGDYTIVGHPDGIVHDDVDEAVLEVKGLSRWLCSNFNGTPRLVDFDIDTLKAVYPSAIPQTRMYMMMFDVPKGIILVKNKDTSELYEFHIDRDESIEKKIINKFTAVFYRLLEDKAPPCDYVKGSKECKYCPFPTFCGE